MNILFATSEAAPFAKTGGLGDVLYALPKALASSEGVSAAVITPLYSTISSEWRGQMRFLRYIYVKLAWRSVYCGLFELKNEGVTYYFIDNEYYFKRMDLYGYFDDGERFAFFSKAVVDIIPELSEAPDVIHLNDWQTALIPVFIKTSDSKELKKIKTVFTIHNIEYQGRFNWDFADYVIGVDLEKEGLRGNLDFDGGINFIKAAVELSDMVTTVSPSYANELSYSFYAHGLEGVISANRAKVKGIRNGIDFDFYNPKTDTNLVKNYNANSFVSGKGTNKAELQRLLGLVENNNIPIIALVSRLVYHKGIDLVMAKIDELMEMDVQVIILGKGDRVYEEFFRNAQMRYSGRFSAYIGYSPDLAMKMYSGADIFLMPSRAEPCGLTQMIAMRYGTIPVVRETGGLRDTVIPYNKETGEGTGFTFANINADDMLYVLKEAVELYSDKKAWKALIKKCMNEDFTWDIPAGEYLELYNSIEK